MDQNHKSTKDTKMGGVHIIWKTWDEFWQETSIAGLANAGKARKGVLRRLIWLTAFTIMFYFSMSQIIKVVQNYLSYPVTTTVTINNEERVSTVV